jgi:hypothetical protein
MLITPMLHSPSTDKAVDIVKERLVLHLDASNPQSYNSDTNPKQWKDISSENSAKIGALRSNAKFAPWHGGYIQFDGTDDWIDFDEVADFKLFRMPFTISYFVRFNSYGGTVIDFRKTTKAEGVNDYFYNSSGGTVSLYSKEKKGVYYTSNFRLNIGQWYHICYVRSGSNFSCYLNGVLDKTVGNADFKSWSGTLRLGAAIHGGAMHGGLGTVLVYKNKALSQADVLQNHNACMPRFLT